jgi:hypothetical protein
MQPDDWRVPTFLPVFPASQAEELAARSSARQAERSGIGLPPHAWG